MHLSVCGFDALRHTRGLPISSSVTDFDTLKHRDKNRRRDSESKEINKEEIYRIGTARRWTEGSNEDVKGDRGK